MCEKANVFLGDVNPTAIRYSRGEPPIHAVPAFDIQDDLRRRYGPGAYVNLMVDNCCFSPEWPALYRFLPVLLEENRAPWLVFLRFFSGDSFELGAEVRLSAGTLPAAPEKGELYRLDAVDAPTILEAIPPPKERERLARDATLEKLVQLRGTVVDVGVGGGARPGRHWIGTLREIDPVARYGVLDLENGNEHCFPTDSVFYVEPYLPSARCRT